MAILGYNIKGATQLAFATGFKISSPFVLSSPATLKELHGWFGGSGANVILHIYADNAGSPGALIAYTAPLALTGSDVELSQSGFNISLAAGTYWIGFTSDSPGTGGVAYRDSPGGSWKGILSGAMFNPPSDPYGTTNTSNATRVVSCWAVINTIEFRASSSGARGDNSPLSVAAPVGTVSGDFLLMIACVNNNTIIGVSGWTLATQLAWKVANGYQIVLAWKIAGASEPAAIVTTSGGAGVAGQSSLEVLICAFSGVDNTTPFDVAHVWGSESSTSPRTVPSITTLTTNAWWVVMASDDGHGQLTTSSFPSGWTQRARKTGAQTGGLVCDTLAVAVAGAQSATSFPFTVSSSNPIIAAGMALRESGAVPPPPFSAFVPQIVIT